MIDTLTLPKDKLALARLLKNHAYREESRLMYRRTMWLLAWYYMNGIRRFTTFDETTGKVAGEYTNANGALEFQSQELLKQANDVCGRLCAIDARPLVRRTGLSLQGIRSRSVAQILLNSAVSDDQLLSTHRDLVWTFTMLGSCGLSGTMVDHPTIGLTADLEIVHPREIYPFPSLGQDMSKVRGIMRQRIVPMDFLTSIYGKKIKANEQDLEWYEVQIGNSMTGNVIHEAGEVNPSLGFGSTTITRSEDAYGTASDNNKSQMTPVVRIRELWMYGPRQTVQRYVVSSGDYIIDDQDLEGQEIYCPLSFARFMENSSFHGVGMFDLLFPLCREHERLITSLFNNVRDTDRYGILVLPTGQYNFRQALQDVGRGLRVLPWEPDPISEGFKPFPIQPWNSGDFPGKVGAMAKQLIDQMSPVADLIREKGRVDSANGLAFLDEQINRAMTNPTYGITQIYSGVYRSLAQQGVHQLTISRKALPVGELTLDLAGAVIDPKDNTVSFNDNPIPEIGRLSFSVKESNPRSEVARKSEGIQMAEMKAKMERPDWDGFILFALREGLDYAAWMEEERSAYESCVRNLLMIYGDGQNSGQIVITPFMCRPDLQLRIVGAFLQDQKVAVASPGVQNALAEYRVTLMEWMGNSLPMGVPNPDDLAMLTAPQEVNPMLPAPTGAPPMGPPPNNTGGSNAPSNGPPPQGPPSMKGPPQQPQPPPQG